MSNSIPENPRDDFAYILHGKLQTYMSKLSSKFGWRKFDPKSFKIERVVFSIPFLPNVFRDYQVVHISDLHFDQWLSSDRLSGVISLINEIGPDVVAITGDLVSYSLDKRSEEELIVQLRKLRPNDATVAVLGNHDHWLGVERVRQILKKSNIFDISNDVLVVHRQESELVFAGVDSVMLKKDRLDLVLGKLSSNKPAILLAHEPDFANKSSATKRFSVQLSGHSHGGQFAIPGLGTPFRGHLFMKYPLGRYEVDDMIQYTNRGLGTNGYWIRINCPPEITSITLI